MPVGSDLSIAGHPEIFVIGDLANCSDASGKSLPGVAQVALQQGTYVARLISNQLKTKTKPAPFVYKDRGNLATIGRSAAVADLGKLKFSGFFRVVAVAVGSHYVHRCFSKPPAGLLPVGLELRYLQSVCAIDY